MTHGSEFDVAMHVAASSGIGGSMHDHPAGPGTLPLFSPADLRGIYRYVKHLNDNGQVPTGYTATVVLHTGETYTLVLEDVSDYLGFGMRWFESEYDFFKFQEEYYNEKAGGIGTTGFSNSNNEKHFLTMLSKEGNGLKLLKTNASSSTWTELTLSSSNVVSIQCP